jgi:NAD(P)-dependent dehydrogenase (short-subunit alcohol dehydrogenase family)
MTTGDTRPQIAERDSVTVITGAGSGIGRALAEGLSRRGRPVVLVGRREEYLLQTRAACVSVGGSNAKCLIATADITESGAVEEVVAKTLRAFGGIVALVNNAGLARFAPLRDGDFADWDQMLRTNLLAPAAFVKHSTPALRASRGVVVNVGSIGGILALPGRALYGASKAALAHLTRSLARELAPDIRVNAVLPGPIETEIYDGLGQDAQALSQLRAEMIRTTPMGRMGSVEDIVPWIELLLSPAAQWVTGSLVVVDGGRSC